MFTLGRITLIIVLSLPISGLILPPDISQGVYCESCIAVMKELDKFLAKKSSDPRELQVVEAIEDVCRSKHLNKYGYSPITLVKACRFLMGKHEEDIEQLYLRGIDSVNAEEEFCYKLSKICEGVDRSKKAKDPLQKRSHHDAAKLVKRIKSQERQRAREGDPRDNKVVYKEKTEL